MQMWLRSFLKMVRGYEQKLHACRNFYTMVQKNYVRISGNWGPAIIFQKTHLSFFVYPSMPGSNQFADTIWSENQIPGFQQVLVFALIDSGIQNYFVKKKIQEI